MKKSFLVFLVFLIVPVLAHSQENIEEYAVNDNDDIVVDYLFLEEEETEDDQTHLNYTEMKMKTESKSSLKGRTSITVSLFYPFYMGSAVDFINQYSFDPNYGGIPVKTKLNGGIDVEVRGAVLDYLLVGGGFSWAGTFLFDSQNNHVTTSNSSMKSLSLRGLIGGIYPIAPWVSFFGGLQGGFFMLMGSDYLESIHSEYKDIVVPCGMVAPFVGFDFILSGGFSLSLKFDFTAGFSGRSNSLNRDRIETIYYPGIYFGCGMVF